MKLTRRQFVMIVAAVAAGCGREKEKTVMTTALASQPSKPSGVVDAGPLSDFKADDVYDAFRNDGCFVIRRNDELYALSSVCTHKGCKLRVQNDRSFLCKCHGSRFDGDGKVTKGPATRDLPRLAIALDNDKHVLINLTKNTSQSPSA
jgi:Rieske Fe-S protein